ncbi:MAG: hypothetical protein ACHBNF_18705 [Chromatiales bacterium]
MNTVLHTKPRNPPVEGAVAARSVAKLAAAALPLWLGLVPLQAHAVDAAGGNSTNNSVFFTNAWTTLRSVSFTNPPGNTRRCAATGSADAQNPFIISQGGRALYVFTLSLDNLNPAIGNGEERTVVFIQSPIPSLGHSDPDADRKEVTSTAFFVAGPGTHTIRWQARRILPFSFSNAAVNDASISVVCTNAAL